MQKTSLTVEKYLNSLPDQAGEDMRLLDAKISEHMPGVKKILWQGKFWGGSEQSICGYGECTFQRADKQTVEWFMVGLALQKNYISVYIVAVENGKYVVKANAEKLGKVKVGSSSVSFKKLADVNLDELLKLVDIAYEQFQLTNKAK